MRPSLYRARVVLPIVFRNEYLMNERCTLHPEPGSRPITNLISNTPGVAGRWILPP
ncbi:MAG: hypothetical protein ABIX10_10405 [Acidimicrobiales bacterium]